MGRSNDGCGGRAGGGGGGGEGQREMGGGRINRVTRMPWKVDGRVIKVFAATVLLHEVDGGMIVYGASGKG